MLLVFLQPDLGTALVYAAALSAVLFLAGVRWLHLALLADARRSRSSLGVLWFLPASGIEVLKPYQTARLTGFANPDSDPSGLHVQRQPVDHRRRRRRARGARRDRGEPDAVRLPARSTPPTSCSPRSPSSAASSALRSSCSSTSSSSGAGLRVITVAGDLYGAVVAGGIVFAFLFQVFVNVGMTMGIAPVTGIPLPFVTVGGSSMVANLFAVGILQAIHARGPRGRHPAPMTPLGIGPRDVVSLARHAQQRRPPGAAPRQRRPRRAARGRLPPGGDRALVRDERRPHPGAAALVRVLAGAPTPRRRGAAPRRDARARPDRRRPAGDSGASRTCSRTDVVDVPPGQGFPIDEIAAALAARARRGRRAARRAAARTARGVRARRDARRGVTAAPSRRSRAAAGPHLPVLALSQARMLSDLAAASGARAPGDPRGRGRGRVAPRLGAAVATGVLSRSLVRRLPVRGRLVDGAVAAAATSRSRWLRARARSRGSVRSGS